jgi:hypothetical protein
MVREHGVHASRLAKGVDRSDWSCNGLMALEKEEDNMVITHH